MKKITCPKNQLTKIIDNFGWGLPWTFTVELTAPAGQKISGSYEERRYFWIFPEKPITGRLMPQMQFDRYWINGIYSVAIKPDCDLVALVR